MIAVMVAGEMSMVLLGPPVRTGVGTWDHDGAGLDSFAHSAGHVVVMQAADVLVLGTIDGAVIPAIMGDGVKDWVQGETKAVGASSLMIVKRSSHHPCCESGQKCHTLIAMILFL